MNKKDIDNIQHTLDGFALALPEGYTWPAELR